MITRRSLVYLLIIIALVRISVITFVFIFHTNQQLLTQITTDIYHHYHLGFAALALAFLFKRKTRKFLTLIGAGIVLEEWTLLLRDIGLPTSIKYLSYIDFALAYLFIFTIYIATTTLRQHNPHPDTLN